MPTTEQYILMRRLYDNFFTDNKIAEIVGVTTGQVSHWRKKNSLPCWRPARRAQKKSCPHPDCFTCPYPDCTYSGPFPSDPIYNQMAEIGRLETTEHERLTDYDDDYKETPYDR